MEQTDSEMADRLEFSQALRAFSQALFDGPYETDSSTRLAVATSYLFAKADLLYANVVELIQHHQLHSSAYLVRGMIETRADLAFLHSRKDEDLAQAFMMSGLKVREAQEAIRAQKGFPQIDFSWCNEKVFRRVSHLGPHIEFAYSYLSALCHSSSTGFISMVSTAEGAKFAREQWLIATENFLGVVAIFVVSTAPSRWSEFDTLFKRFLDLLQRGAGGVPNQQRT